MAAIQSSWSSLGVGSGLDLETLVHGLMRVEQKPLDALKQKLSSYNTRISAGHAHEPALGAANRGPGHEAECAAIGAR